MAPAQQRGALGIGLLTGEGALGGRQKNRGMRRASAAVQRKSRDRKIIGYFHRQRKCARKGERRLQKITGGGLASDLREKGEGQKERVRCPLSLKRGGKREGNRGHYITRSPEQIVSEETRGVTNWGPLSAAPTAKTNYGSM